MRDRSRKRLYLAGPDVFLPDPDGAARDLKASCAAHGFEGVFPLDADPALSGLSKPAKAQAIYDANVGLIRSCDGLLANMDPFRGPSMDVGTAFEMGFATAWGLPVVGYSAEADVDYLDRVLLFHRGHLLLEDGVWRDPDGMEVEDFGQTDNLMMCGATSAVARDLDQALLAMRRLFDRELEKTG